MCSTIRLIRRESLLTYLLDAKNKYQIEVFERTTYCYLSSSSGNPITNI